MESANAMNDVVQGMDAMNGCTVCAWMGCHEEVPWMDGGCHMVVMVQCRGCGATKAVYAMQNADKTVQHCQTHAKRRGYTNAWYKVLGKGLYSTDTQHRTTQ
jgi:hypothetical protein